jgi:hypothetical protein
MFKQATKNIVTIKKNLFTEIENLVYNIVVPHVCNNKNIFGGGFTAGIVKNYPIVSENYRLLGKQCALGYTQFVTVKHNKAQDKRIIFANMIAQNGTIGINNPRPLNYYALAMCMKSVYHYISDHFDTNDCQIHSPKFGSGLAGGNWNFINELIFDCWNKIPVFVYNNNISHRDLT